jgi:hypothetical protein
LGVEEKDAVHGMYTQVETTKNKFQQQHWPQQHLQQHLQPCHYPQPLQQW